MYLQERFRNLNRLHSRRSVQCALLNSCGWRRARRRPRFLCPGLAVRAGGQLQAHGSLLSACMLHMHVYAVTTIASPAAVFRTAPEDNEALEHCGEWLVPLQCAGLLQATVALSKTPEDVLVRGSSPRRGGAVAAAARPAFISCIE